MNVIIRNCIIFSNFGYGLHVYGEGSQEVDNAVFENNISYNSGKVSGVPKANLLMGRLTGNTVKNLTWKNNCTYRNNQVAPNRFGYDGTLEDGILTDNYMPDGCTIATGTLTQSGNVVAPEASNKVFTYHIRGKMHAAIYNWESLDTVDVTVTPTWKNGDQIRVRNVADYFADFQILTVAGGKVTVSMTGRTRAKPQGWDTYPEDTFPTFGAFVFETYEVTMTRTVTGTFKNTDGTADSGTLSFELLAPISATDGIYLPETRTVTLDASGQFSLELAVPATSIASYRVTLPDGSQREFALGAGSSVDIAALLAIDSRPIFPTCIAVSTAAPVLIATGSARLIAFLLVEEQLHRRSSSMIVSITPEAHY